MNTIHDHLYLRRQFLCRADPSEQAVSSVRVFRKGGLRKFLGLLFLGGGVVGWTYGLLGAGLQAAELPKGAPTLSTTPPAEKSSDAAVYRLECRSDFENGSGVVEGIDQRQRLIRLRPTEHSDRGWTCWWFVHVIGIQPGEVVTVELIGGRGDWGKPDRAAFSTDGAHWRQTAPGQREKDRILYRQKIEASEAFFAWGPPFRLSDAERLLEEAAQKAPWAEKLELCRSREGRSVPVLRIAQPGASEAERRGVWIVARQHAWECGGSWVAWGLIDWLLSDDSQAAELRKKATFMIVPIMDVDNVCRGAGGKEQKPHDHNRDWSDKPHWPEVQAVQAGIRQWDAQGRMDLFLDLHNPARSDRQPFFFIPDETVLREAARKNTERFLEAAKAEITQPMKLADKPRVSGRKYDLRWERISTCWIATHCREHVAALCLETPWDTPHSTVEGYMAVGRALGRAISRYFQSSPRPSP